MTSDISRLNNATTDAYNQLMSDVSANGTSAGTLEKDADHFLNLAQLGGGKDSNTQAAVQNMKASLGDGTYSQQGTQGALEGAAQRDGMSGVSAPLINGSGNLSNQLNGNYDGGSSFHSAANGGHGDLAANLDNLMDEIKGGAPSSQIQNNARALATEAQNSGNSQLASAATNIANSLSDGTYNAQASLSNLHF